ncbi:GIY-YIG nuclease family protein [Lewinella cohaerens]
MFSVYILYSEKHDKYYVGQTDDLERRLLQCYAPCSITYIRLEC